MADRPGRRELERYVRNQGVLLLLTTATVVLLVWTLAEKGVLKVSDLVTHA